MRRILCMLICAAGLQSGAFAASAQQAGCMSREDVGRIVTALDAAAAAHGKGWRLQIDGHITLVTVDGDTNRLRVMVPIRGADGMKAADLMRMLQANFDSTLDARYAVARGLVWAVFARPLRRLDKAQLIAGVAQTVTLARTHGALYSGGALQFGGGDSAALQRNLLDDLMRRGDDL